MAINEKATAQVYLDGKQAEAAIDSLKTKSKELGQQLKEAVKVGDTATINKLEKEIKSVDAATRSLKKETYDYEAVLKNINGASYNQLNKALRTVRSQMNRMSREDAGFAEKQVQVKRLKAEIASLNNSTRSATSLWSKFTSNLNRNIGSITAIGAAITGAAFSVQQFIKGLVGLDDELANVMKTTGMAKGEVRDLYSEFNQLNTRTSKSVLLQYAEEAGRLGKQSKGEVLEFVEVANKIGTALGDDLGDAPEAIREVGKLVNIFGIGEQYGVGFGESMEKIGSAINEIAANSSASAGYQIDFLKRLSGTAKQANVTANEILGYSSVLDQNGQAVEMAATAQSKLMVDMFTNPAKYAEVAGMKLEAFTNLLRNDTNEAFLLFLEGINSTEDGFLQMASTLNDLGIGSSRQVNVLSTLASNTDAVRKEQELANIAMQEGISLTNEYEIKNNNLAGSWEKIQNQLKSIFVNTGFIELFENSISKLAKSMENGSFDKFLKWVKELTAVTLTYIGVRKIANKWDLISLNFLVKKEAATKALAVIQGVLTGKIKLTTIAQKAMNKVARSNPYTLIATAVTALSYGLYKLMTAQTEAEKAQERLNKSLDESRASAIAETKELARLKGELSATTKGTSEYNRIKNEIVQKYGKYQSGLDAEIEKVGLLEGTYDSLTAAIQRSFGARQYDSFIKSEQKNLDTFTADKLGDIQDKLIEELGDETGTKIYTKLYRSIVSKGLDIGSGTLGVAGIDAETQSALDQISGESSGDFVKNKELEGFLRDIIYAQKAFDELDEKAKNRFGIDDNTNEAIATTTQVNKVNNITTNSTVSDTQAESTSPNIEALRQEKINEQKQRFADDLDSEKQHKLKLLEIERWYLQEKLKLATGLEKLEIKGSLIDNQIDIDLLKAKGKNTESNEDQGAKLLQEYETIEEAKTRITAEWTEKRKALKEAGGSDENLRLLDNDYLKQLDSLSDETEKVTNKLSKLFEDMSDKSADELKKLADEAKNILTYLTDGEYRDGAFGISEEDFNRISNSPDELKKVNERVNEIEYSALMANTAIAQMGEGIKALADGNITEGLGIINQAFGEVTQAVGILTDSLDVLSTATGSDFLGNAASAITDVTDVASQTLSGAAAGSAVGGPIGAIVGGGLSLVTGVVSKLTGNRDNKKEKEIQEIQGQVDALTDSYNLLNDAIDNAYGVDAANLIEEQNDLLEEQNVQIQKQIEKEKEKKKPDDGQIQEWENQIEQNLAEIESNNDLAIDFSIGTSFKSDLEAFSDAYVDAFAAGEDRAEAQKEVVKDMLQSMATDLMNTNLTELVTEIRKKMAAAISDGIISDSELNAIENLQDQIYAKSEEQADMLEQLGIGDAAEQSASLSGGFETISQDTASELNGRFTAFQSSNEVIKIETIKMGAVMVEMKYLVLTIYGFVEEIRDNTNHLPEISNLLGKIEKYFKEL